MSYKKNPQALSSFSQFVDNTAIYLACFTCLASVIKNNPSYGKVRLFFCYVGIRIGIAILYGITQFCLKHALSRNDADYDKETKCYKNPKMEPISLIFASVSFCSVTLLLGKLGKIDVDFAKKVCVVCAHFICPSISIALSPIIKQFCKQFCKGPEDVAKAAKDLEQHNIPFFTATDNSTISQIYAAVNNR